MLSDMLGRTRGARVASGQAWPNSSGPRELPGCRTTVPPRSRHRHPNSIELRSIEYLSTVCLLRRAASNPPTLLQFVSPCLFPSPKTTEDIYSEGVLCLQRNDYYGANAFFKTAAEGGNASAIYNLALINSTGMISPYDVGFSISCLRLAAALGHPKAKGFEECLGKAEDTTLGTTELNMFAAQLP